MKCKTQLLAVILLFTASCILVPSTKPPQNIAMPGWYRISVEKAIIALTNEIGKNWDSLPGTQAPDTYVQIIFDQTIYNTPVVRNTFQPMWVGSFDAVLGVSSGPAVVRILLWDRDVNADDPIGEVSVDLYEVIHAGGSMVINSFGRVSALSISVRYEGELKDSLSISP